MTMQEEKKTRRARKVFSAQEKAQAVLSVWSGRRSPGNVCKSLGIAWGLLSSWEKVALGGIQVALGQEKVAIEEAGLNLGVRLERLMGDSQVKTGKGE